MSLKQRPTLDRTLPCSQRSSSRTSACRAVPCWSPKVWLLDDLVRSPQHRGRDGEAESFGGLRVDHQLKLRRLLDGKVTRLGTFEDPIDIARRTVMKIDKVGTIGHQPACFHVMLVLVDARQTVLHRQLGKPLLVTKEGG